jgi:hypothetical protein
VKTYLAYKHSDTAGLARLLIRSQRIENFSHGELGDANRQSPCLAEKVRDDEDEEMTHDLTIHHSPERR